MRQYWRQDGKLWIFPLSLFLSSEKKKERVHGYFKKCELQFMWRNQGSEWKILILLDIDDSECVSEYMHIYFCVEQFHSWMENDVIFGRSDGPWFLKTWF